MGLTYHEVRELLLARRGGASFAETVTVGRQNLFLHPRDIRDLTTEFRLSGSVTDALQPFGTYADRFLRCGLETSQLEVIDASPYEGATIVHDLNTPLPIELVARFDAVIDGGT